MTTTTAINNQDFGATAGASQPYKVAAQTATTAFVFSVMFTAASGRPQPEPRVMRVYYSSSPFDMTAAQAVLRLAPTARYIDIPLASDLSGPLIKDGTFEPLTGGFIYAWLELDVIISPIGKITLSLQEI